MGTPDWAIPSLQAVLDSGIEISAVFTQPDRPVGRKRVLTPSSIKQFSQTQKLPVHTPEKAGNPETLELVRSLSPELIIVCAYGQILPQSFLETFLGVFGSNGFSRFNFPTAQHQNKRGHFNKIN